MMIHALPPPAVRDALLAALETAGVGLTVVVDRAGTLERAYTNEAAAAIFGRSAASLQEVPPMVPLPAAERERLAVIRTALGEQETGGMALETTVVRDDGASVPLEVGLAFVPIDGARATFAFLRDVSAKAAMEAALRESELRFRSVAEASPDSITIVSGGKFTYANPSALAYLGLTSFEQLKDVDPWSLTPPDQREASLDYTTKLMRGEEPSPMVFHSLGPDGSEKVFESSMRITSVMGEPAVIAYTRDITDRMALQAELVKRDRLACVGMLAAGVAHELNNPLASIALQTRSLCDGGPELGLSESVRSRLGVIQDAASRMSAIIADLLFMARPAEQPQSHVDLAQVVESTVALVRAGGVALPITVDLVSVPPVVGYASKLGQVFLNLLRNASESIKDDTAGAIRVVGRVDEDKDEVVIVVEDNGAGIAKDLLPRVTEPFFTTKPKGTGLGLWISQSLVADHGGRLHLESVEGSGTTVALHLPLSIPIS